MESLWREQTPIILGREEKHEEGLLNNHREVIVVGAGMAGLLIAFYLKECGKEVLVLEADTVASGQTERTTAKITSQHGLKYSKLIRVLGVEKARLYAKANEKAITEYEKLITRENINCQFQRVPAYLYTCQNEKLLLEEAEAAIKLGIDANFTRETELPFQVFGAVIFQNQACFSPLEFLKHIAAQLEIKEHTSVISVRGNQVMTKDAVFTANKVVIATHFPVRNMPGLYFMRQHQERSYVLVVSGAKEIMGMYLGIDQGGLSFRQAGDYLLLGGSSVRTGENQLGNAYDKLRRAAEQYFPDCVIEKQWAAQDCMPHDGIPFIGKYSVFTPNLYVATGFQKWGMTTSMIAAQILKDEICGKKNPYAGLFSPQRLYVRAGISNFFMDIGKSAKGLSKGLFGRNKVRCPHMGCELVWNAEEKSRDCPCHGSRFDEWGNLMDNPAKKGLAAEILSSGIK